MEKCFVPLHQRQLRITTLLKQTAPPPPALFHKYLGGSSISLFQWLGLGGGLSTDLSQDKGQKALNLAGWKAISQSPNYMIFHLYLDFFIDHIFNPDLREIQCSNALNHSPLQCFMLLQLVYIGCQGHSYINIDLAIKMPIYKIQQCEVRLCQWWAFLFSHILFEFRQS